MIWTHGFINRLVILSDCVLLLLVGFLVVHAVPLSGQQPDLLQTAVLVGAQASLFVSVMSGLGAYRVERYERLFISVGHAITASTTSFLLPFVVLLAFFVPFNQVAPWLTAWFAAAVATLILARMVARLGMKRVHRDGLLRRRVVMVEGSDGMALRTFRRMRRAPAAQAYDIIGVVGTDGAVLCADDFPGLQILSGLDALPAFAAENLVDLVVLATTWDRTAQVMRIAETIGWIAADIILPFDEHLVLSSLTRVVRIAGLPSLQLQYRPLKGSQLLIKTLEDYVIGTLALLLVSPLLLLAAVAIRLDGPGPILFRQRRTGLEQRPFHIYKLRTMNTDPNDDGSRGVRSAGDVRITRVGRYLRRCSVDELPQLINVLRGEMSLVGPRPYAPNMQVGDDLFRLTVQRYASRYRIKPGITGYSQARGLRGAILHTPEAANRSVELDLYYITHWSLWLDIRIIFRTLVVGLTGRNVF